MIGLLATVAIVVLWFVMSSATPNGVLLVSLLLAHLLVVCLVIRNLKRTGDLLTPTNILVALALIRFTLPVAVISFGGPIPSLFAAMGLEDLAVWYRAN